MGHTTPLPPEFFPRFVVFWEPGRLQRVPVWDVYVERKSLSPRSLTLVEKESYGPNASKQDTCILSPTSLCCPLPCTPPPPVPSWMQVLTQGDPGGGAGSWSSVPCRASLCAWPGSHSVSAYKGPDPQHCSDHSTLYPGQSCPQPQSQAERRVGRREGLWGTTLG